MPVLAKNNAALACSAQIPFDTPYDKYQEKILTCKRLKLERADRQVQTAVYLGGHVANSPLRTFASHARCGAGTGSGQLCFRDGFIRWSR